MIGFNANSNPVVVLGDALLPNYCHVRQNLYLAPPSALVGEPNSDLGYLVGDDLDYHHDSVRHFLGYLPMQSTTHVLAENKRRRLPSTCIRGGTVRALCMQRYNGPDTGDPACVHSAPIQAVEKEEDHDCWGVRHWRMVS